MTPPALSAQRCYIEGDEREYENEYDDGEGDKIGVESEDDIEIEIEEDIEEEIEEEMENAIEDKVEDESDDVNDDAGVADDDEAELPGFRPIPSDSSPMVRTRQMTPTDGGETRTIPAEGRPRTSDDVRRAITDFITADTRPAANAAAAAAVAAAASTAAVPTAEVVTQPSVTFTAATCAGRGDAECVGGITHPSSSAAGKPASKQKRKQKTNFRRPASALAPARSSISALAPTSAPRSLPKRAWGVASTPRPMPTTAEDGYLLDTLSSMPSLHGGRSGTITDEVKLVGFTCAAR